MLPTTHRFDFTSRDWLFPRCTAREIHILEESLAVSASEKVHLLAILLGLQWITEIESMTDETVALSQALGLAARMNLYEHSRFGRIEWLQVATNEGVLEYAMRSELTVLEAGVLYGYPPSACLAFMNLLPRKEIARTKDAFYFFAGVVYDDPHGVEREHFHGMWNAVRRVSPTIAAEASHSKDIPHRPIEAG